MAEIAPEVACHFCLAPVSGFIFSQNGEIWRLDAGAFSMAGLGQFGVPPTGELVRIGSDRYGFLFKDTINSQGYEASVLSLYAVVAGKLETILSARTGERENSLVGSALGWSYSSTLHFEPNDSSSLYDLVVRATGTHNDRAVSDNSVYTFDGSRYILRESTNPEMFLDAGYRHYVLGDYQYAVADLTHFLSLNVDLSNSTDPNLPGISEIYSIRGQSYLRLGQYQTALDDFAQAQQMDDGAQVHLEAGQAYAGLGDIQDAIDEFGVEIRRSVSTLRVEQARCNRGLLYARDGQPSLAKVDLEDCLRDKEFLMSAPDLLEQATQVLQSFPLR